MKTLSNFCSQQIKLSAIGTAVALVTLGVTGCGGGGDSVSPTTITISGAGNSPFVNVEMTATCANGASGKGIIGATTPGDGTITIASACTPPIKIKATGKGKMRPIGGQADGSQDVAYDPALNLPIGNIFDAPPAPGSSVTANPVTSLIELLVTGPGGSTVAAAKSKVETSLAMPAGATNNDYKSPDISRASSQLAAVAALAVQKLKTTTASQEVLAALASSVAAGQSLTDAPKIADAIKTKSDVTGNPAVTGNEINNDAARIYNMLVAVQGLGTSQPASKPTTLAGVSDAVSQQPDSALHLTLANKLTAILTYVKEVIAAATSATKEDDLAAADAKLTTAVTPLESTLSTANSTAATTTSTTVPPTTTTAAATTTTAAPTTTTAAATTTTAAPTTTTAAATTTTAAPTTTTAAATTTTAAPTTTTTATTTTTTIVVTFSGICEVKVGSAIGYMTNVPNAGSCTRSVINIDGGGATVAVAPATLLTGKTSVSFASALTCDPFGAPPAAGAVTVTACKQ